MATVKEIVCGNCVKFWNVKVAKNRKELKETALGHCLVRTVYAANKAGNPVYPPGSKVEVLPFAQHKIAVVRNNQDARNCPDYKEKA
jgi:hypothetical protein